MSNVYLKLHDAGTVTLWGGPVALDADNINPADQAALDRNGRCLTLLWERAGDDGAFWRRTYILFGVEVVNVRTDGELAHIQLPGGSWLVLENTPFSLQAEAAAFGILHREPAPKLPTWLESQARAVLYQKDEFSGFGPSGIDPYEMG